MNSHVHEYKSIRSLFNAITVNLDKILGTSPINYIYRGQADSTWPLLPSALRSNGIDTLLQIFGEERKRLDQFNKIDTRLKYLAYIEANVLHEFVTNLDKAGIRVPFLTESNIEHLKAIIKEPGSYELINWPHKHFHAILAYAQHSDLPTRLLDFTYSILKALYFAADSSDTDTDATIVVYAFNKTKLPAHKVTVLESLVLDNECMRAQEGLFVIPNTIMVDGVKIIGALESYTYDSGCVHEFRIHSKYKYDILKFLDNVYGINSMRMFPTTAGVVRYIKQSIRF